MLQHFLQTLMDAVAVGSLYALIALGYTMVYGILKFINFAHSDVFTLGAWVSLAAAAGLGGEQGPVAVWVLWVAGAVVAAAGVMQGYERLVRGRLPSGVARRLPGPGSAAALTLVAAWGALTLCLVYVARWMQGVEGLRVAAGGVILVIAMLACGLVGLTIERMAYKPLTSCARQDVA